MFFIFLLLNQISVRFPFPPHPPHSPHIQENPLRCCKVTRQSIMLTSENKDGKMPMDGIL